MGKLKVSKAASKSRAGKTNQSLRKSTGNSASENLLAQMSFLPAGITPLASTAEKDREGNGQHALNGAHHGAGNNVAHRIAAGRLVSGELSQKIKELVRLAQEQ